MKRAILLVALLLAPLACEDEEEGCTDDEYECTEDRTYLKRCFDGDWHLWWNCVVVCAERDPDATWVSCGYDEYKKADDCLCTDQENPWW